MLIHMRRLRNAALAGLTVLGGVQAAPALAASKKACDVAREYIRLTDEGQYDRIGDLWAEDAVFYAPTGAVIRGKTAIRQFYSGFLRKITPVNRIGSLTYDPKTNFCAMEIQTRVIKGSKGEWVPNASGDFHTTVIDLFSVNKSGKVQSMKVFLAPMPLP